MTDLQLTPSDPPPGTPEDPGAPPETPEDPGVAPDVDAPGADEAREMRLEHDEVARAVGEGMVGTAEVATEPGSASADERGPGAEDVPSTHPGFEETR